MKNKVPPLSGNILEGIARIIGDTERGLTGSEIGRLLLQSKLKDIDSTNTKWKRIYNSFIDFQNKNHVANNIFTFILYSMDPARFIGNKDLFEDLRETLNQQLAFAGFKISESGKLQKTKQALTLSEAQERAVRLKSKLSERNGHPEIFKYCHAELLSNNYFHSVFEAVKSIAERIRNITGLTNDGSNLIDQSLGGNNPLIKINDFISETEISEQKGFVNLLKGVFGMFRNTTAHAPKIMWTIYEQDALDILSTISLIHRKLDNKRETTTN